MSVISAAISCAAVGQPKAADADQRSVEHSKLLQNDPTLLVKPTVAGGRSNELYDPSLDGESGQRQKKRFKREPYVTCSFEFIYLDLLSLQQRDMRAVWMEAIEVSEFDRERAMKRWVSSAYCCWDTL